MITKQLLLLSDCSNLGYLIATAESGPGTSKYNSTYLNLLILDTSWLILLSVMLLKYVGGSKDWYGTCEHSFVVVGLFRTLKVKYVGLTSYCPH